MLTKIICTTNLKKASVLLSNCFFDAENVTPLRSEDFNKLASLIDDLGIAFSAFINNPSFSSIALMDDLVGEFFNADGALEIDMHISEVQSHIQRAATLLYYAESNGCESIATTMAAANEIVIELVSDIQSYFKRLEGLQDISFYNQMVAYSPSKGAPNHSTSLSYVNEKIVSALSEALDFCCFIINKK